MVDVLRVSCTVYVLQDFFEGRASRASVLLNIRGHEYPLHRITFIDNMTKNNACFFLSKAKKMFKKDIIHYKLELLNANECLIAECLGIHELVILIHESRHSFV